jgi:hypothetical protein
MPLLVALADIVPRSLVEGSQARSRQDQCPKAEDSVTRIDSIFEYL